VGVRGRYAARMTSNLSTPGGEAGRAGASGAAPLSFEQKLQNYADLIVQVGAGLSVDGPSAGQRVLVQAPVDTAPLARAVVDAAYRAGASFVDVRWDDDAVVRSRFANAPDGTFETISQWRVDAELEVANAGGPSSRSARRTRTCWAGWTPRASRRTSGRSPVTAVRTRRFRCPTA